jgi:hypothetical protein
MIEWREEIPLLHFSKTGLEPRILSGFITAEEKTVSLVFELSRHKTATKV